MQHLKLTQADLIAIERELASRSLVDFAKMVWPLLEPATPLKWGWALDAICAHLEAVTRGEVLKLLMNVPPGTMKSLLTNVIWPAWEWGPAGKPHLRHIGTAHKQDLAIRDSLKCRRLIQSRWYQERWPTVLASDQNAKTKFENDKTGFMEAMAFKSMTGSRGDRVRLDDPISADDANSEAELLAAELTFTEALPTRVNNDKSAIVVIMQRLHEDDVSGLILEQDMGYVHLMLPMRFEADRRCETPIFIDPREEDGELLFPERFDEDAVERLEKNMTQFAVAGQLQQRPEPRGGGIIKRSYWRAWDDATAKANGVAPSQFPSLDHVIVSLDTAFTEKQENDATACTVWGLWRDRRSMPRLMLMHAWAKRLEFNDLIVELEKICKRFRCDYLLIEAKANGISVAQEIRRRNSMAAWQTRLIDPKNKDKVARAYAVQGVFEAGMVYAPDRTWADLVISQCATFPKGKHDDLVDSTTQALAFARDIGMLRLDQEIRAEIAQQRQHRPIDKPLYET